MQCKPHLITFLIEKLKYIYVQVYLMLCRRAYLMQDNMHYHCNRDSYYVFCRAINSHKIKNEWMPFQIWFQVLFENFPRSVHHEKWYIIKTNDESCGKSKTSENETFFFCEDTCRYFYTAYLPSAQNSHICASPFVTLPHYVTSFSPSFISDLLIFFLHPCFFWHKLLLFPVFIWQGCNKI